MTESKNEIIEEKQQNTMNIEKVSVLEEKVKTLEKRLEKVEQNTKKKISYFKIIFYLLLFIVLIKGALWIYHQEDKQQAFFHMKESLLEQKDKINSKIEEYYTNNSTNALKDNVSTLLSNSQETKNKIQSITEKNKKLNKELSSLQKIITKQSIQAEKNKQFTISQLEAQIIFLKRNDKKQTPKPIIIKKATPTPIPVISNKSTPKPIPSTIPHVTGTPAIIISEKQ